MHMFCFFWAVGLRLDVHAHGAAAGGAPFSFWDPEGLPYKFLVFAPEVDR